MVTGWRKQAQNGQIDSYDSMALRFQGRQATRTAQLTQQRHMISGGVHVVAATCATLLLPPS